MTDQTKPEMRQINTGAVRGSGSFRNIVAIYWQMSRHDHLACTIPGTSLTVAAWKYSGDPFYVLAYTLPVSLLYFTLYLAVHNLADQYDPREDAVNKPHRPLAARNVTVLQMKRALSVTVVVFLAISVPAEVFTWSAVWCLCVFLYAFLDWDKHWATKSLYMIVGTAAQLAAAWQLVTPPDKEVWIYILTISVATGIVAPIQDIRDIEGDMICGRRTVPIVLGERRTRRVVALLLLALGPTVALSMQGIAHNEMSVPIIAFISTAGNIMVIYRLLVSDRTRRNDFATYQFFSLFWFTFLVASVLFVVW